MKFTATHNSLDLQQLVMVKGGVVYIQTDDFMDCEAMGYAHEYHKDYLLKLEK